MYSWIEKVSLIKAEYCNCPGLKAHVRRLPTIKHLTNKWKLHRNDHNHVPITGVTNLFGIYATLYQDRTTMEDQMHRLLLFFNNEARLKIEASHVLHLLFDFRESHTIAPRSEHITNELITFNFVRTVKSIGLVGITSA